MEDHGASSSHNHRREEDNPAIPSIPPSSPLTTAFHRHPQRPTPSPNAEEIDPFLRRRPERRSSHNDIDTPRAALSASPAHLEPQSISSHDTVLISIATPYNDVGGSRRNAARAVPMSTSVVQIKNDIAAGKWDGDEWERRNMRLVWQGRIIRDEEVLRDVFGKVSRATLELISVADVCTSMLKIHRARILFTLLLDGNVHPPDRPRRCPNLHRLPLLPHQSLYHRNPFLPLCPHRFLVAKAMRWQT